MLYFLCGYSIFRVGEFSKGRGRLSRGKFSAGGEGRRERRLDLLLAL